MLTPPPFWEGSCCPPFPRGDLIQSPCPVLTGWAVPSLHHCCLATQNNDWTHLGHLLIIRLNCLVTQKVRKIIGTLAVASLVSPIWRLQRQVNNQSQDDVQCSLLSPKMSISYS